MNRIMFNMKHKKKRKKKVNKALLVWKTVILISLILNTCNGYNYIARKFSEQPAVKRWVALVFAEGLLARADRYWGGNR